MALVSVVLPDGTVDVYDNATPSLVNGWLVLETFGVGKVLPAGEWTSYTVTAEEA